MTSLVGPPTRLMPGAHWDWMLPTSFSQGWRLGRLLLVGGQIPVDPAGAIIGDNPVDQLTAAMENVRRVLAEGGLGVDDLVKLNLYLRVDPGASVRDGWEAVLRALDDALPVPGPAVTVVGVSGLGRAKVMIEVEGVAIARLQEERDVEVVRIMPSAHWDWPIPTSFSQGWKVGDLVFVGGQVSAEGTGRIVGEGDIEHQTRNTFDNIRKVLAEVGGELGDIVKLNTYYTFDRSGESDDEFWKRMTRVRLEYLGDPGPAATAVRVAGFALEHTLIEIEAIALLGLSSRQRT
jgi:enamine deaminase RidA (YjgF/YER057c/UK114 family)